MKPWGLDINIEEEGTCGGCLSSEMKGRESEKRRLKPIACEETLDEGPLTFPGDYGKEQTLNRLRPKTKSVLFSG